MEAFFDLIAPAANALVDFVERFWPSLLLLGAALLLMRGGRRAPRMPAPAPRVAYAIVAALSIATIALTYAVRGEPRLDLIDDYGYLLTADTFLHGRLANPTHPLARHFDALYQLQHPTYAATYFPGNGLFLALGRLVSGHLLFGMQLAALLATLALYWALRGWIAEGWAFALGCLVAVHPTMAAWSNSYHGGAVSACGGALMVGAVARLRRGGRAIDGAAFGIGATLLALTRPYEGFVVGVACIIVWLVLEGRARTRPLIAALSIVAAAVAFLLYFDWRVTGDALKAPYVAYNERYLSAPNFVWQRAGAMPRYDHPEFARIYRFFRNYYARNRSVAEFRRTAYAETMALLATAIPNAPPLDSLWLLELLPFGAFLLVAFRNRDAAAIALALGAAWISLLSITWFVQPHYAAPSAGLMAVAVGIGLTTLRDWLARAAYGAIVVAALTVTISAWHPNGVSERTRVEQTIAAMPGQHLVLVDENCSFIVFNAADIDAQRVIWARDLGDNDELLRRYAGRSVWSFRCDGAVPRVTPARR